MLLIIRVRSFPRLQASCVQPAARLLARKCLANSSTVILQPREGDEVWFLTAGQKGRFIQFQFLCKNHKV